MTRPAIMAQRIFSSHGAQSSQVRELNWNAQTICNLPSIELKCKLKSSSASTMRHIKFFNSLIQLKWYFSKCSTTQPFLLKLSFRWFSNLSSNNNSKSSWSNSIFCRNTLIQVTARSGGIAIFLLFPFLLFCPVLPALLNHHAAIRPLCSPVKQHNVLFQLDKSNKNSLLYLFRICSHNLDL